VTDEFATSKARAGGESAVPAGRRPSLPFRARTSARRMADRLLAANLLWSGLLVGIVTALLVVGGTTADRVPGVGEILDRDVVAHAEIEIPDAEQSDAIRRTASDAVPDVYIHDETRGERLAEKLSAALVRLGDSIEVERELGAVVRGVMGNLIVGSRALLENAPAALLVHLPDGREERISGAERFLDLDEARAQARAAVRGSRSFSAEQKEALAALAASFVDVNVSFDAGGTRARREAAMAAARPALRTVPAGTVLARAGDRVTGENRARIEASQGTRRGRVGPRNLAGTLIIVSLLAFFLWRYGHYHQRAFRKIRHLHALLVLVILSMLVLSRAMLWIAAGLVDDLSPPFNDAASYTYLVPLAGGSILVALLASGRISMVYSGFTALLFAAMNGWNAFGMTWALLVQWAGIYAISSYRERAALLRAGFVVGAAGGAAALAIAAVRDGLVPVSRGLYEAGLAFVGGAVGTGLLVSFALPLLEGLFRVLTDIRLLELANVNQPLLSEFAVKAPGSYNHSLVLGSLAEEAAKAIGANSLYCRVAAFYHDIGKIKKPEYYVENQHGVNPHDRLSPFMSALIIAAHVKDGIRLAREAGLPEQIVDVVPQHHGTRVMTFFYDKARRTADPSLGPVSEADFRYPGPKPRTKETAIFMLADAVEAAARTLDEPTPGRLGELIHKMSGAIVLDGQLDECDLTFADLERIEEAFLRTLTSMYHHRVDYPGFEFGHPRPNDKAGAGAPERRSGRSVSK
jgi:cyclic-di-AMP phosphodiesterase PgpH